MSVNRISPQSYCERSRAGIHRAQDRSVDRPFCKTHSEHISRDLTCRQTRRRRQTRSKSRQPCRLKMWEILFFRVLAEPPSVVPESRSGIASIGKADWICADAAGRICMRLRFCDCGLRVAVWRLRDRCRARRWIRSVRSSERSAPVKAQCLHSERQAGQFLTAGRSEGKFSWLAAHEASSLRASAVGVFAGAV